MAVSAVAGWGGRVSEPLRVLDLFSGIGGFSLGLERTGGFRTVAFCEVDPFCRAVLRKHWPHVPIFNDVRELHAVNVGAVDVICGGFPCQDISVAGKAAGIEGARSGMWVEYLRLIDEIRPRWVPIENVAALRVRGADRVLSDLEGIGYTGRSFVVGSYLAGAPFIGERVWIVASPSGEGLPAGREISFGPITLQPMPARGGDYRAVAGSLEPQREWEEPRLVESPMGGATHGLPARLVRFANGNALKAYGNALTPAIPEIIGRAILQAEGMTA